MARESGGAEQEGDRWTTCSKCRKKVLTVITPGLRTIQVFMDTDVRWYVATDVGTRTFRAKPVHAHQEHECWKEQDDQADEAELGLVEVAPAEDSG